MPAARSPAATCPASIAPAARSPAATRPATTGPAARSPAATHPATTGPAARSPAATRPTTTGPAARSPAAILPATIGPAARSRAATFPATTGPTARSPAATLQQGVVSVEPSIVAGTCGKGGRRRSDRCLVHESGIRREIRRDLVKCMTCGAVHIDEKKWATVNHQKHLCSTCGSLF